LDVFFRDLDESIPEEYIFWIELGVEAETFVGDVDAAC